MEYTLHKSTERGSTKFKWLESFHSFSFGRYINPKRISFGKLVVFNDDTILPEKGFSTHPHDNMEIITIVTDGTLEHNDSMGSSTMITAGEIQVMTAGTGITHSETNPSKEEAVHLFQIWIEPRQYGLKPSYQQKKFDQALFKNKLYCVVSGAKEKDHLGINQDATLHLANLDKEIIIEHELKSKRGAFIFSIEGSIKINDQIINSRDSIEVNGYQKVNINSLTTAKIILIDVPMSK